MKDIRSSFPILERKIHGFPLVYLDSAATTLKPKLVVESLSEHFLMGASNIHRGVYLLSEEATAQFEGVRDQFKDFLNASDRREIVFTSGTTESINLVAATFGRANLKVGDEVLISAMEHHSNIIPWQMLCEERGCVLKVIPMTDQGELEIPAFEKLVTEKTKLISIVHVSNSIGTVNPIKKIIEVGHRVGAKVLVDAAQSVTFIPLDVQALDCDFLVLSGHKMFGPTGTGILYAKAKLLEEMPPYKGGGDMIASVTFEKTTYNEVPYKFEAGTPNIGGVIALGKALGFLQKIGIEQVAAHDTEILNYGHRRLSEVPGLRVIGTARDKGPVISFYAGKAHPHDVGTLLDQTGICVRTGHHCTQPVMRHFGVPATVRASFSIYNNSEDVDRLAVEIEKIIRMFE